MPSVGGRCILRHLIEPRPRYVKLDRGLVTGITADPIRQARGSSIGVEIIAEGVETEAERLTLTHAAWAPGSGLLVRAMMYSGRVRAKGGGAVGTCPNAAIESLSAERTLMSALGFAVIRTLRIRKRSERWPGGRWRRVAGQAAGSSHRTPPRWTRVRSRITTVTIVTLPQLGQRMTSPALL